MQYRLFDIFERLHLFRRDCVFGLLVVWADLFLFLLLATHDVLTFLFISRSLLRSDSTQSQVILKPFVLVLVIDEVCQEAPVAWCFFRALDDEIIALVTEVWHSLHINDLVLDMHQLLESERVTGDGDLGVANLKHSFQLWRY